MSDFKQLSAFWNASVPVVSFVFVLPVFAIEISNRKADRSQNAQRTHRLMIAVLISNTIFATAQIIFWLVCWHCTAEITLWILSRWIMKGVNLIFLIHRAKLGQGMAPVLNVRWFEKILPRCIIIPFSIFTIISVGGTCLFKETVCKTYSDTNAVHHCDLRDELDDGIIAGTVAMISFDFIVSAFLLALFLIPLYRVYREDLGNLNENQLRQKEKLRNLLLWCIVMSTVNQITSALHLLPVFGTSSTIWVLWTIGKFDPAINVWTSWLMITRNRQYLVHKWNREPRERRMLHSAISDVRSPTFSRQNTLIKQFLRLSTLSSNAIDVQLEMKEGS